MKRKVPKLRSDAAAEAFLDGDVSELHFSQFCPTRFKFKKKMTQLDMRLPASLRDAVKQRASEPGIPGTRFVREAVELALTEPRKVR